MRASPDDMTASTLLKRWRSQIGPRLLRPDNSPRTGIAVGYLVNGPVAEDLICIEDLILTVLYDQQRTDGPTCIRLAGYSGRAIPWGACWGQRSQQKFEKDLGLPPERCARGPRIELTRERLLEHALELDQLLERSVATAAYMQTALRLPILWAAFRLSDARSIKPAGPEFEALKQRLEISANDLLASYRRRCLGLLLLPAEWVSHAWQQWATVFADLSQYPRQQCLSAGDPAEQLQGFTGAVKYDLLASRFRGSPAGCPRQAALPQLAAAIA